MLASNFGANSGGLSGGETIVAGAGKAVYSQAPAGDRYLPPGLSGRGSQLPGSFVAAAGCSSPTPTHVLPAPHQAGGSEAVFTFTPSGSSAPAALSPGGETGTRDLESRCCGDAYRRTTWSSGALPGSPRHQPATGWGEGERCDVSPSTSTREQRGEALSAANPPHPCKEGFLASPR
jgi:hypothetical protein